MKQKVARRERTEEEIKKAKELRVKVNAAVERASKNDEAASQLEAAYKTANAKRYKGEALTEQDSVVSLAYPIVKEQQKTALHAIKPPYNSISVGKDFRDYVNSADVKLKMVEKTVKLPGGGTKKVMVAPLRMIVKKMVNEYADELMAFVCDTKEKVLGADRVTAFKRELRAEERSEIKDKVKKVYEKVKRKSATQRIVDRKLNKLAALKKEIEDIQKGKVEVTVPRGRKAAPKSPEAVETAAEAVKE